MDDISGGTSGAHEPSHVHAAARSIATRNDPLDLVLRCRGVVMASGTSFRGIVAGLAFAVATGAPASAHTGVFIGGAFGYPWPYGGYYAPYYPYPAYPYYPPYPYYPYPAYQYGFPPPGWEPGHWEWRQDASGRSIRVWVPQYLR